MNMVLRMQVKQNTAILERLLGVIRFRGCTVEGMHVYPHPGSNNLDVEMKVTGTRGMDHLRHHLAKLIDVQQVDVFHQQAAVMKMQ